MLHFVTSFMKQNKSRKQTLESAQYGLEISFNRGNDIFDARTHNLADVSSFSPWRSTCQLVVANSRERVCFGNKF